MAIISGIDSSICGHNFRKPQRLDNCEIPHLHQREYGLKLRDYQWIDYFEDDGFEQLVRSINHHFPGNPGQTYSEPSTPESSRPTIDTKAIDLGYGVTLELVRIPGGTFLMGSPKREKDSQDSERPRHKVIVPEFWMGKYPITQAQYSAVTGKSPSKFKGARLPVESVSWRSAVAFCEQVSQKAGETICLPSEAQWEYACRAGTAMPFHFGETLSTDEANYNGQPISGNANQGIFRERTTLVGSFAPNGYGLYDMHGNVWEWCQDHWHERYQGAPTDGSVWAGKKCRVLRGGSWSTPLWRCRSAFRRYESVVNSSSRVGFRVVGLTQDS